MFPTQGLEEDGVTAFIEREKILTYRRQTVKHLQDFRSLYHLKRSFSAVIAAAGFNSVQVSDIIHERSGTHAQNT